MNAFPINNIIRSVDRVQDPKSKLHILTMCKNDEKYISLLAQTKHNFYILPHTPWNSLIEDRPSNVYPLTPLSPPIDYVICYDRAEQYDEILILTKQFQVPLILVDMCSKSLIRPQHLLEAMHDIDLNHFNRKATLHVYSDTHIAQSWTTDGIDLSQIIPIGIDIDKFQNMERDLYPIAIKTGIALDNNTVPHVGAILGSVINNIQPIFPTDHENKTITVNTTKYFINTSKHITIKTLEAMAAESIAICLNTPDTANCIQHQETGWLLNDLNELPNALTSLENSDELRIKIATQARQHIIANHSLKKFVSQWLESLNMLRGAIYHPT